MELKSLRSDVEGRKYDASDNPDIDVDESVADIYARHQRFKEALLQKPAEKKKVMIDREASGQTVVMRDYQLHLADPALLRQYGDVYPRRKQFNTLIVAPTGSGKTVVAQYIMRAMLENNFKWNNPARILVLVPNVALIDQQTKEFNGMLSDIAEINGLAGKDLALNGVSAKRIADVLKTHVTLMTPDIFLEFLTGVPGDSHSEATQLLFYDFNLIIIDECHHTDKSHPYNRIMQKYRQIFIKNGMRRKDDTPECLELPQIVALTATPGDGGARPDFMKSTSQIKENIKIHLAHLMARLCCTQLSTIFLPEHQAELERTVSKPIDDVVSVKYDKHKEQLEPFRHFIKRWQNLFFETFDRILFKLINERQQAGSALVCQNGKRQLLKNCNCDVCALSSKIGWTVFVSETNNGVQRIWFRQEEKLRVDHPLRYRIIDQRQFIALTDICNMPAHLAYVTNALKALGSIQLLEHDDKMQLWYLFQFLQIYFETTNLYLHVTLDVANNYMMSESNALFKGVDTDNNSVCNELNDMKYAFLNETEAKSSSQMPLYKELIQQITTLVKTNGTNCRILIFVLQRRMARELCHALRDDENFTNLNACYAVGAKEGKHQHVSSANNIEKFREGFCRILVVTDVVSEGLDVPTCNLVILYNQPPTNTIGMKQKLGRARAFGSRMVLISDMDILQKKYAATTKRTQLIDNIVKEESEKQFLIWKSATHDSNPNDVELTPIQKDIETALTQIHKADEASRQHRVPKATVDNRAMFICSCMAVASLAADDVQEGGDIDKPFLANANASLRRISGVGPYVVTDARLLSKVLIRYESMHNKELFGKESGIAGMAMTNGILACPNAKCRQTTKHRTLGFLVRIDDWCWIPSLNIDDIRVRRSDGKIVDVSRWSKVEELFTGGATDDISREEKKKYRTDWQHLVSQAKRVRSADASHESLFYRAAHQLTREETEELGTYTTMQSAKVAFDDTVLCDCDDRLRPHLIVHMNDLALRHLSDELDLYANDESTPMIVRDPEALDVFQFNEYVRLCEEFLNYNNASDESFTSSDDDGDENDGQKNSE